MSVFINKGIGVRVPPGGLRLEVGADGSLAGSLSLHLSLATWPYWLTLATRHARTACDARMSFHVAADDAARGAALEAEFAAGMQAVVCAAVAIDAFYTTVKDKVALPATTLSAWRKGRTARHRQACEVFRRAFKIGNVSTKELRMVLPQIFGLRDRAVHPNAGYGPPVLHPDLKISTEWRFVEFRSENARACAKLAVSLVSKLLKYPNQKHAAIAAWVPDAVKLLEGPLREWATAFGDPLFRDQG